jgi:aldose 1-epimerase
MYTCDGINNGTLQIPRKNSQGGPGTFYENHSCLVIEQESAIAAINYPSWNINQIYGPNRTYEWNAEYAFTVMH